MNVDAIKASLGEQDASVHPEASLKKQLQQEGLRQAADLMQQSSAVKVSLTQSSLSLKMFGSALSQTVEIDGKRVDASRLTGDNEEPKDSLFDFEEVAKNVMSFVGGVINAAAKSGADDAKLHSMFEQARSGVAKGIDMAKQDLGSMMNNEIATGIENSASLIEEKMQTLEQRIFGQAPEIVNGMEAISFGASDSRDGDLRIRTKDGDEVTIRFESVRSFEYNQATLWNATPVSYGNNEVPSSTNQTSVQQTSLYQYFEKDGLSFSVQGELDEDELEAIADLVEKTTDLAETFFSGDMEKALEEALSLGYDKEQLAGFALNLNHKQQSSMARAYQNVQQYQDDQLDSDKVKPVTQYLEKLMAVLNQSDEKLEGREDFNALVSEIINQMEEVHVPDLVSAINRFHTLNQKLVGDGYLPSQSES